VTIARRVAPIIGLVLHIPMLLIFYVQGLVMPGEGVAFLIALWVALTVGIFILWRRAPLMILLVPVVDVALVYGVTAIGRALFGWHL